VGVGLVSLRSFEKGRVPLSIPADAQGPAAEAEAGQQTSHPAELRVTTTPAAATAATTAAPAAADIDAVDLRTYILFRVWMQNKHWQN